MEEKKKRSKRIFHDLPEAMIQHIQSFMTGKEASGTALLSKSWCNAWLTRPTLHFSLHDPSYIIEFEDFATTTIQRYRDSSRKIESFNLIMADLQGSQLREFTRLVASTIIAGAMEIGAVHLNLKLPRLPPFVLPLTSQTLATVSVENCEIEVDQVGAESSLKSLKSLSFERVCIRSDDVFRRVASSSSSSMEELSLSRCYGGAALSRANMFEFRKLRRLFLDRVIVKSNFFSDFATRFPCLKDLGLAHCSGHKRVEIAAAASLERVTYAPVKEWLGSKFDVPNIRKFTYAGRGLPAPSLCVEAGEWEWEFDLSIKRDLDFRRSWLVKMNKSLRRFGEARISLSLHVVEMSRHRHDERESGEAKPLPEAVVLHSLSTNISPSLCRICYHLLFRLFKVGNFSTY